MVSNETRRAFLWGSQMKDSRARNQLSLFQSSPSFIHGCQLNCIKGKGKKGEGMGKEKKLREWKIMKRYAK